MGGVMGGESGHPVKIALHSKTQHCPEWTRTGRQGAPSADCSTSLTTQGWEDRARGSSPLQTG